MTLQRIIIKPGEYNEMCLRGGKIDGNAVLLAEGERLSFDTYINCFSYTEYRDYTTVNDVTFTCEIQGEANVSLMVLDHEKQTLLATKFVKDGTCSLSCSLEKLPKEGVLYPVIEALTALTFVKGEYTAQTEPKELSVAIAICTFKREKSVLSNLEVLKKDRCAHISKVYVIDNGKTLDVSKHTDDFVKIIPNKNYGGTGGFTRGIMEGITNNHSHVILMDDDVIIDTGSIEKMCTLVSILKNECKNACFSAAMLPLSKPYLQYEMGARWDGGRVKSFKQDLDVRLPRSLVLNTVREPVQYGGWWCFMLPVPLTEKIGLPYPMFIKHDDIEYGARCSELAPIITMNGVFVSHEDFNSKYSIHLDYYKMRNQLIMLATHSMKTRLGLIFRLMKTSANTLFLYRYDAMPLIFKAFDDFLLGADYLISLDEEELNREIMEMAPASLPLAEIEGWDDSMRQKPVKKGCGALKALLVILTLGGHILPPFMLKKGITAFPPLDAHFSSAFRAKRTIQYQLGSDYGFDFGRNVKKFFKYLFGCIKMSFKILFKYGKAKRSYEEKKAYLSSYEFWEKHLGE